VATQIETGRRKAEQRTHPHKVLRPPPLARHFIASSCPPSSALRARAVAPPPLRQVPVTSGHQRRRLPRRCTASRRCRWSPSWRASRNTTALRSARCSWPPPISASQVRCCPVRTYVRTTVRRCGAGLWGRTSADLAQACRRSSHAPLPPRKVLPGAVRCGAVQCSTVHPDVDAYRLGLWQFAAGGFQALRS
jgi:hypothetical protein